MKNYWILTLLIPFFCLSSCLDDTSAYLPQEKETVNVDQVTNEADDENGEDILPEGELVPGIHLVKLTLPEGDSTVERRFKYFMPISIDATQPISLIFELHGNMTFDAGVTPADPLSGITVANSFAQHAIQENCIICFPAGAAEYSSDGSGSVGWQGDGYQRSLPFIDAIIEYFKERTPTIDANRIYATGQSSGGIFSWVLAFYRSEIFAAVTPRAGQMALTGQETLPTRAVPVRVFAGTIDESVQHDAVITNTTAWAEKIGGYFASDMVFTEDSIEIENYRKVDTRIWSGGKADYQIFSLKEQDHYISAGYCMPYMWEFMANHTLDNATENLYITTSIKEIVAQCSEPIEFSINYTDGATLSVEAPQGWELQLDGHNISLTAPKDYFSNIVRNGEIKITVSLNGKQTFTTIPCTLTVPKTYFEIGDIYYNENFKPIGVVYQVNQSNIREAKIINLKTPGQYGTILYCGRNEGLGLDFQTPDRENGELNTSLMLERNNSFDKPYGEDDAAFVWAAQYSEAGESGWYLPAIEELKIKRSDLTKINEALTSIKGVALANKVFSSTTEVKDGKRKKTFYTYDFTSNAEGTYNPKSENSEYTGYITVRAMKKVSK